MSHSPQYDDFVLPDNCGEDSSSASEESEYYDEEDENELMEAAFFPSPSQSKNNKENGDREVVDLCDSDNENVVCHQGVARLGPKSPRFNQMERRLGNSNPEENRFMEPPQHDDHNDDDDDIVECWSSDEEKRTRSSRSLGTTMSIRRGNHGSKNAVTPFFRSNTTTHLPTSISGSSASNAPIQQNLAWRSERPERRRRLRNATNSHFASAVEPRQGDFNVQQVSRNVWYCSNNNTQTNPYSASRNDLQGGSGAGLGGFDFHNRQAQHSSSQYQAPKRPASWKQSGAAPKKRASGGGKKKWGKKGGWRRKGGGYKNKKGSSNNTNSSRGRSRGRRSGGGDQPYMEISQQDPKLKHVGGANIIF